MVDKSVIALAFCLAAVFCMVLAFASPYWVESFTKADNRFVKCGLWEFCFNEYTFYKDYKGKIYLGCWYIFSQEYRPIWEWLSPPWFISCQVMASLSLLFQVLTTIVLILKFLRCFPTYLYDAVLFGCSMASLFVFTLVFITLVVFGVKKEDRQWVPRPDQNYLSWSYGLFAISGILTLVTVYLLFRASRDAKEGHYIDKH